MHRRLRIALVRPCVDVIYKFSKRVEALGLGYVAAALRRAGHEVVILDAMLYDWTVEESCARIHEADADIVGFTVVLNHFPDRLITLLDMINSAGTQGIILVGGHAVSFFPENILRQVPRVDGVVSGEGEIAMCQIAEAISAGVDWRDVAGVTARGDDGEIRRRPPNRVLDLNTLAWPARDMTSEVIRMNGVACISTSRGCYKRCTFCSVPRFYGLDQDKRYASGAWLCRNPEDIVEEIAFLRKDFGARELLIVDDEFFGGSEMGFDRARKLGRLLAERDFGLSIAISCRAENVREDVLHELKRGGLSHVFVGVEAGSERALQLYGKDHTADQNFHASRIIKSLGLTFQAGFMLFNPRSTLEDLRENMAFLDSIGELKPSAINSAVDPYFGAPLVQLFRREGVLVETGLKLGFFFRDERVGAVKTVAEMCATAYQPFMNFIAAVRSSITFEWRRPVPGRTAADERLLESFEQSVNSSFTNVAVTAVNRLLAGHGTDYVLNSSEGELKEIVENMQIAQALTVVHFEATEGGFRRWDAKTARDAVAMV